ncbi:DUF551 domain-containing protein [Klebsiella pneumoniae]|nr:DUF551 domain-containing protein [Klebsiella pneumoniae]MCD9357323.1 DUF551 domain-containing protein [Klebsiella pneumoniae]
MTKSTITRDELNEVIATYGKHHIAHRMANVLLAAMDSEPDCKERKLFCSTDTTRMRKTISVSAGTEDAPLYRHAQQPVVSADLLHTAASAIEDLLTTKDRTGAGVWFDLPFRLRSEANAQPAPVVPDGYVMVPKEPTKEMIDAGWLYYMTTKLPSSKGTYKAMLAAAPQSPGSEPATVPGKWIPVSERMPEEGGRYWCYVEDQNSLGKSHYQWNCSWNGDVWSDKALTGRVTHWMPLPAGPQEVR